MYKIGDYVKITKAGDEATGEGNAHDFEVGQIVRIAESKQNGGCFFYRASSLDNISKWTIDEDCSTLVASPLYKIGDKVRITKDGKYTQGRGAYHDFKVGEVVAIKTIEFTDSLYYVAESLDGERKFMVNYDCTELVKEKGDEMPLYSQYTTKITLPGQHRGFSVKLSEDGNHRCTCKTFKTYGKCEHIVMAVKDCGHMVGLGKSKEPDVIIKEEPEPTHLELIASNAKWRLR